MRIKDQQMAAAIGLVGASQELQSALTCKICQKNTVGTGGTCCDECANKFATLMSKMSTEEQVRVLNLSNQRSLETQKIKAEAGKLYHEPKDYLVVTVKLSDGSTGTGTYVRGPLKRQGILTNNHVLTCKADAAKASVVFNFTRHQNREEDDEKVNWGSKYEIKLDPAKFFVTNRTRDYAFVGMAEDPGVEPFDIGDEYNLYMAKRGAPKTMWGHPNGKGDTGYRMISDESPVLYVSKYFETVDVARGGTDSDGRPRGMVSNGPFFSYSSNETAVGSSGSPVFFSRKLMGIHFAGGDNDFGCEHPKDRPKGLCQCQFAYAIQIHSIAKDIELQGGRQMPRISESRPVKRRG